MKHVKRKREMGRERKARKGGKKREKALNPKLRIILEIWRDFGTWKDFGGHIIPVLFNVSLLRERERDRDDGREGARESERKRGGKRK